MEDHGDIGTKWYQYQLKYVMRQGIREFLNLLETAGLKEMEVCSCGIAPSHNTSLRLGGIAGLCSLMLLCPLRMPSDR